jgi:plasmid replication initiation protein
MASREIAKQEVKKHVSAIHTSVELTLLERKLVNVLLLNAYDKLLTEEHHSIPIGILATLLGWTDSNNLINLKKALKRLQTTTIEYDLLQDGKKAWTSTQVLGTVTITEGICTYDYPRGLPEKLANPDVYATINIGIQNKFAGSYSLALYENCLRFKKVGSTGWHTVDLWRSMLGAKDPHYDEFKRFNSKIIAKAVAEINTVSDIEVTPEFRRENRRVTHIRFLVEENRQKSIFDADSLDEYAELRQSDIYKRLRTHGIGDKLAIMWILQETEEKIGKTIDYVEDRDKKSPIKSTGAYIRKLIEEKAIIGDSDYEKKRKTLAEKAKEAEDVEGRTVAEAKKAETGRSRRIDAAIKELSKDETRAYAMRFLETGDGSNFKRYYDPEKGVFKRGVGNIAFIAWLRPVIAKSLPQE